MEVKSCSVTISDMEGITHTVEITAATLYEAVALGLKQLQGNEWVEGIARGLDTVRVSVKSVQIEHTVTIGGFTKWLASRQPRRNNEKKEGPEHFGQWNTT
jgi:hypothetical protein